MYYVLLGLYRWWQLSSCSWRYFLIWWVGCTVFILATTRVIFNFHESTLTNFLLTLRCSIYFLDRIFKDNGNQYYLLSAKKKPRCDFGTGRCDQFFARQSYPDNTCKIKIVHKNLLLKGIKKEITKLLQQSVYKIGLQSKKKRLSCFTKQERNK